MINRNFDLEPRGENEPKYNPNNKTDKKLVTILSIVAGLFVLIAIGCFLIYYFLFYVN